MNGKNNLAVLLFAILFVSGFSMPRTQAAIKDTDVDGLSDEAEVKIYKTDPLVFDTDGDTRGDGDEILDGTDPLDKASSTIAMLSKQDVGLLGSPEKFAWYIGRSSGILAFILLTGVVVFGLIISSRAFTGYVPGAMAYETHRFIAWLALGTVILHFSSFFFDNFMKMKVVEALVPFTMSRDFQTALGFNIGWSVALGVIAFYFILILVFTSQFRSKISPKLWRGIHYISAAAYVLFVLHGFMTGTDSKEWWMRALYATSVSLVSLLILTRIIFRNLVPKVRAWWKIKTEGMDAPLGN
jgi:predicted ferric reductase